MQSCDCGGCEKDEDCVEGEYCHGYRAGCYFLCYPSRGEETRGVCRPMAAEGEECCDPEQASFGNCEFVPCAEGLRCTFDTDNSIPPRCRVPKQQ